MARGGAGGLSRAASLNRLWARLRRRRSRTLDLYALDALARRSQARITYGNRVGILIDGAAAFAAMEEAVASARASLSIEMYMWRDDRLGRRFAALVADRARGGVRVRVVVDAFGCRGEERVLDPIARAGGKIAFYRPLRGLRGLLRPGRRNHRKLLIADGRVAFVSGRNIGEEYSEEFRGDRAFRDLTLKIEGPAVRECVRLFLRSWARCRTDGSDPEGLAAELPDPAATGPAGVQVTGTRGLRGRWVMRDGLVALLRLARREAVFAHAYFFPDKKTFRALRGAARRGVRVRVLLPGVSDVPIAREAGRAFYGRMLRCGIEVMERRERMLHMKAGVVDGEAIVAGSANLDTLSLLRNEEIGVMVFDRAAAGELRAALEQEAAACRRVEPAEWERRSRLRRLLERISVNLRAWSS